MTCKHTEPFMGGVVTITPPPYACVFCEMDSLRDHLAEVERENTRLVSDGPTWIGHAICVLHECVDLTDPKDPVGAALTRAGLERVPYRARLAYEEIESQRDALQSDVSNYSAICSKVNDAIGRAGIHCALDFWEGIDRITQERDTARSQRDFALASAARTEHNHFAEIARLDGEVSKERADRTATRELFRKSREADASWFARLQAIADKHLTGCDECNYDKECTACEADGEHEPASHSCNCGHVKNFGWQLHEIMKAAQAAIAKVKRG